MAVKTSFALWGKFCLRDCHKPRFQRLRVACPSHRRLSRRVMLKAGCSRPQLVFDEVDWWWWWWSESRLITIWKPIFKKKIQIVTREKISCIILTSSKGLCCSGKQYFKELLRFLFYIYWTRKLVLSLGLDTSFLFQLTISKTITIPKFIEK